MAKPLHSLLKTFHENYGVFFKPADKIEAQKLSVILVKNGFSKIPSDYIEFLGETDGLSSNGFELYGLSEHERDNGAFYHTGITSDQDDRKENPLLKNKLIIGNAPELLIAYNGAEQKYELLNRCDYMVLLKLPRLLDVLYYFAPEK